MIIKNRSRLLFAVITLLMLAGCTSDAVRKKVDNEGSALINARLGLAYMQQGSYEVALEKLKKALAQDPGQATAHHYIAELYRQFDAPEKARIHYKKALKLMPNDHSLNNSYGVFLCDQGEYEDAEKSFLMAVQNAPVHKPRFEFYENLAQCMMRKPDLVKAEEYFRIVLAANPQQPVTLYQMARLSFDDAKYLRARAFYQRFTEVSQQSAETLWLGVRIERKLGDKEAAGEFARQLKVNYPLTDETVKLLESEQQ